MIEANGSSGFQVLIVEAELQADEVVAPVAVEDVVDAGEHPQLLDELVAERDAPARLQLFAEAEEVLPNLEAVVQEVRCRGRCRRSTR